MKWSGRGEPPALRAVYKHMAMMMIFSSSVVSSSSSSSSDGGNTRCSARGSVLPATTIRSDKYVDGFGARHSLPGARIYARISIYYPCPPPSSHIFFQFLYFLMVCTTGPHYSTVLYGGDSFTQTLISATRSATATATVDIKSTAAG